jgi:lipopolysaccharide transport system ATP-binding protein
MSDAIIAVSNLGKKYRIRHQAERQRYTALRDVLANKFKGLFQRRKVENGNQKPVEDFWALKDVSFEVKRGEVVGIIGRNGAGKSTLLKILSRITEPTTGRVHLKGRVASLLEVGTGFHPELTGRENIFLNGAILGMHRAEIRRKFDEIVAFAEVEKFLDTPVKHYSSGMYVRLAFAVAAHLEPEILIVDEVLAVGDAQFQNKCLGKMEDVAKAGRTILFVSHNMGVIRTLCTEVFVLSGGDLVYRGPTLEGIQNYLSTGDDKAIIRKSRNDGRPTITAASVEVLNGDAAEILLKLEIDSKTTEAVSLEIKLFDGLGIPVGFASIGLLDTSKTLRISPGVHRFNCQLQAPTLSRGNYRVSAQLALPFVEVIDSTGDGILFHFDRSARDGEQRVLEQSWGYGAFEIPMTLTAMEHAKKA